MPVVQRMVGLGQPAVCVVEGRELGGRLVVRGGRGQPGEDGVRHSGVLRGSALPLGPAGLVHVRLALAGDQLPRLLGGDQGVGDVAERQRRARPEAEQRGHVRLVARVQPVGVAQQRAHESGERLSCLTQLLSGRRRIALGQAELGDAQPALPVRQGCPGGLQSGQRCGRVLDVADLHP